MTPSVFILMQCIAIAALGVTVIQLGIQRDRAVNEVRRLSYELDDVRFTAGALIRSLPKCDQCEKPATRAWVRGQARLCDDHGELPGAPEYPRAKPLRALIRVLSAEARQ